jgi:soluble cytochrome b562
MVQYTLAQSPEVILNVPGKDSPKAREKAMDQLMELMDTGKLPTDLSEGFGPHQFIEVKEPPHSPSAEEDAITQAVQILSNLATLKLKVQESRTEALKVREQIDVLFSDAIVSEAEIASLKEGFKVLKTYAQSNLRYREARVQAEQAREVLDKALSTKSDTKSEPKADTKSEPKAEPETKAKPEPKAESDSKAELEAKPESEPKAGKK